MERMTRGTRQSTIMSPRQVRRTVLAVLLCSALAGCGSVTASAPATPAAAAATGGGSVDRATSVTVHRVLHLVEPTQGNALSKTQHNATLVRALFGQLCAAVSHP